MENKIKTINNKFSFKQKWNSIDKTCPSCGQVTKKNIGLTKQNLKKLFKKPTIQEWLIFLIIILMIFAALSYKAEVGQCKYFIENPEMFGYYYDESHNFILNNQFSQGKLFQIDNNENT